MVAAAVMKAGRLRVVQVEMAATTVRVAAVEVLRAMEPTQVRVVMVEVDYSS
jgi:hypothetical protein